MPVLSMVLSTANQGSLAMDNRPPLIRIVFTAMVLSASITVNVMGYLVYVRQDAITADQHMAFNELATRAGK